MSPRRCRSHCRCRCCTRERRCEPHGRNCDHSASSRLTWMRRHTLRRHLVANPPPRPRTMPTPRAANALRPGLRALPVEYEFTHVRQYVGGEKVGILLDEHLVVYQFYDHRRLGALLGIWTGPPFFCGMTAHHSGESVITAAWTLCNRSLRRCARPPYRAPRRTNPTAESPARHGPHQQKSFAASACTAALSESWLHCAVSVLAAFFRAHRLHCSC